MRVWRVLACAVWLAPGAAWAAEFTAAQRAEIVAVVRDAMRHDPGILRDAIAAVQADDAAQARVTATAAIRANREALSGATDPYAGNRLGDLTIVEFYDTRCPYCRALEPEMAKLLKADHGIRLVYKDFPILGPASVLGAKAVLAADKQGAYERMRASLMRAGPAPTAESIRAEAVALGLDAEKLARDMDSAEVQARIDANAKLGKALGIDGTPSFVVGDQLIVGVKDLGQLQQIASSARGR